MIVCDNNSTDRTAAIAQEYGARVVFEPVNQISRARNAGAAVASGQWLLFLDADSVPTPGLFAEALAALEDPRVLFVGACVRLEEDVPPVAALLLRGWNLLSRTFRWMAGSFVLVEAAAFREVGGFSARMYAAEEVDLSRKLKALARREGRRVAILREHPLTSSARRMKLYSRSEILRFVGRSMLRPWSVLTNRKACAMWYDGRR